MLGLNEASMTEVRTGLKAVATLEAFKGLMSLLVGFGLHALAGQNLRKLAEEIVTNAHLNPASHFPSIFITVASSIPDSKMSLLAIGALVYALVRLIEAYGLWHGLVWVEWFALVSGAIYLPFEIYEIIFHISLVGFSIFLINILVVWYMAYVLFSKKKAESCPI
tara:strand:- start:261 stop:755 length:495 start_codon:yes stop_codon:yes gene_type:complete